MRHVLLIGGGRDGDRVTVEDDYTDRLYLPARLTAPQYYDMMPSAESMRVEHCQYKLERFQAGTAVMWVGYPPGVCPEHGLAMLMAGYVGNSGNS